VVSLNARLNELPTTLPTGRQPSVEDSCRSAALTRFAGASLETWGGVSDNMLTMRAWLKGTVKRILAF